MDIALSSTRKQGFYERTILKLLSAMEKGRCTITLPSGETLQLGNGEGIEAHVRITTDEFFKRCVLYGDIGFGEAYMYGEWETDNITNVIRWFILNIENAPSVSGSEVKTFALNTLKFFNRIYHSKRANSLSGSKKNISEHYDLHNDFFALFLDETMTYSSAYFKEENMSLKDAQIAKYDRLCKQLHLKPTDHVLEIGTGWGGNAIHMAKNYGCKVTSATISQEQYKLAKERVEKEGLSDQVKVVLQDYRLLEGCYDKIAQVILHSSI
jgi:cyclopropane-fatty-acyl-phospholipid synthase